MRKRLAICKDIPCFERFADCKELFITVLAGDNAMRVIGDVQGQQLF